jgi:hypothetical protein
VGIRSEPAGRSWTAGWAPSLIARYTLDVDSPSSFAASAGLM